MYINEICAHSKECKITQKGRRGLKIDMRLICDYAARIVQNPTISNVFGSTFNYDVSNLEIL